MSTKIKLEEVHVGKSFPATWKGTFTEPPEEGDIEEKKSIIQQLMNDDKERQVEEKKASAGFKLVFDWAKKSEDPLTYALTVELARDGRFDDDQQGEGQEIAPTPLKPPPPPK